LYTCTLLKYTGRLQLFRPFQGVTDGPKTTNDTDTDTTMSVRRERKSAEISCSANKDSERNFDT
jgi:hypothetical protein